MPGSEYSPRATINAISQLLRDRYKSGYPILKELLQNADDARARRFRADFYDVLPGSEDATNPLLTAQGVLVLNDGRFSDRDGAGMRSFSESAKAGDSSQAGKFGVGQKAVFHLCDAFVVVSRGHGVATPCFVYNPFVDLGHLRGSVAKDWDKINATDEAILRALLGPDSWSRCLGIWIPFRSEDLRPAPEGVFTDHSPVVRDVSREWSDREAHDNVCTALTLLKYLRKVTISQDGTSRMVLQVTNAEPLLPIEELGVHPSLAGAESTYELKPLRGRIRTDAADSPLYCFVGRQVHDPTPDGALGQLVRKDEYWPSTFTDEPVPSRETGQAHGAVTLWRNASAYSSKSKLTISWAVFLPVSSDVPIAIDISGLVGEDDSVGDVHILLHGYFFLDSGRKRIEGVATPAADRQPAPGNEEELRREWNAALCEEVVLPLLPRVLHDALRRGVVDGRHFPSLLKSLVGASWFTEDRRSAICHTDALVCALDLPESTAASSAEPAWDIVSATSSFRPLPDVETPARAVAELFPDVHVWATDDDVVLCIRPDASLTAEPMEWPVAELTAIFRSLSSKAFQSPTLTTFLGSFVKQLSEKQPDALNEVAPTIAHALRRAIDDGKGVRQRDMPEILAPLPPHLFCTVPNSLNRHLIGVLARAGTDALPVPEAWLRLDSDADGESSATRHPTSAGDAAALILALAPELEGKHEGKAGQAITWLVDGTGDSQLAQLAGQLEEAQASVCRVRNVRRRKDEYLSLGHLKEKARKGWVFEGLRGKKSNLLKVAEALPDVQPVIARKAAVKLLTALGCEGAVPQPEQKRTLSDLINNAREFAGPDRRGDLLVQLLKMEGDHDVRAMRLLCAGLVMDEDASLYWLPGGLGGLERIIRDLRDVRAANLRTVVLERIIEDKLRGSEKRLFDIKSLDVSSYFEEVVQDSALLEALEARRITEPEMIEFLRSDIRDGVLEMLPIFGRTDGTVACADGVFHVTDSWPVPPSLGGRVAVLEPCGDSKAAARQQDIVDEWSAKTQIETALAQSQPHEHWQEILEAVAGLKRDEWGGLRARLCRYDWIPRSGAAGPVSPGSVLDIRDEVVDEWRALEQDHDSGLAPLIATCDLSSSVRDRSDFSMLGDRRVLPSPGKSYERLRQLLRKASIVGRLGPTPGTPVAALAGLANAGANLKLPGWPLLASLIRAQKDTVNRLASVGCFASVSESDVTVASDALNALADAASDTGAASGDILQVYRHGIETVAKWSPESRENLFRKTRVPTEAGEWRSGKKVVRAGHGLDPRYVLERQCADILNVDAQLTSGSGRPGDDTDTLAPSDRHPTVDMTSADLKEMLSGLDDLLAKNFFRRLEDPITGRLAVPDRLAVAFLALLGDRPSLRAVADRWCSRRDDISDWWTEIRGDYLQVQIGLEIDVHDGKTVSATSLSNDRVEVPLDVDSDSLLIGNTPEIHHNCRVTDGRRQLCHPVCKVQVRHQGLTGSLRSTAYTVDRVLRFAKSVSDILGWSKAKKTERDKLLDMAANVSETTLRKVTVVLRDRFPATSGTLTLPAESQVGSVLAAFEEGLLGRGRSDDLKRELWKAVDTPPAHRELLVAMRERIMGDGYRPDRIVFELFQNANDAYRQVKLGEGSPRRFRLRLITESGRITGFRAIHWGRPINHLGDDADYGHSQGYGDDLRNMLLLNASKKEGSDAMPVGRFGLGFKSVHLVSDSVGIASRFLALRIYGGLIPGKWDDGVEIADGERLDGWPATVIDVPWGEGKDVDGQEAVDRFWSLSPWVLLFGEPVRRIELCGKEDVGGVEMELGEAVTDGIRMVAIGGQSPRRVLILKLGGGFSTAMAIGAEGPTRLAEAIPGLWNLAPLEEGMSSGCILNGPFELHPGRLGRSDSPDDRIQQMGQLGKAYGEQLLRLHDAAIDEDTGGWNGFVGKLGLGTGVDQSVFWGGLFDVVCADLQDESVVRHLHGKERGYGRLAANRPIVPSRLPGLCDKLVTAEGVRHVAAGALADPVVGAPAFRWPKLAELARSGSVVSRPVAEILGRLGFGAHKGRERQPFKKLSVSGALAHELGRTKGRVAPELATRLGEVINTESIDKEPLSWESHAIRQVLSNALFQCRNGWGRASAVWELYTETDGQLLSGFAPANVVLHPGYQDHGLKFFKVAKAPCPGLRTDDIHQWASDGTDESRQRAVLKYVVHGVRGRELANAMKKTKGRPKWLPGPREPFSAALLPDWPDPDKAMLDLLLGRTSRRDRGSGYIEIERDEALDPDEREFLEKVGKTGEKLAFEYLKKEFNESGVEWVSKFSGLPGGDDSLGYDFRFVYQGRTWHVEVKSTAGDPRVFVSENQWYVAREKARTGDEWCILHVRGALSDQPQFYWLPNRYAATPVGEHRSSEYPVRG